MSSVHRLNDMTLSDEEVIAKLLANRWKIDAVSVAEQGGDNESLELIIIIYADLDKLISKCKWTSHQMNILNLIMNGYTVSEIASDMHVSRQAISYAFKDITRKIKAQNDKD